MGWCPVVVVTKFAGVVRKEAYICARWVCHMDHLALGVGGAWALRKCDESKMTTPLATWSPVPRISLAAHARSGG